MAFAKNTKQSNISPLKRPELRILPQNIEAEKALLGSLLIRPENIFEIIDIIHGKSFYLPKNGVIFDVMVELSGKHIPIDILSVASRIKEKKLEREIDGIEYLTELNDHVPTSTNIMYYAKLVSDKFSLRNLIEAGHEVIEYGFDEQEDIGLVLDKAEKKIFQTTQSPQGNRFLNIKEILPQTWTNIENLATHDGSLRGVPSGFSSIDNLLAGFQKSDLIILAARPSVGKTSLALDFARHAALNHNVPVGIFSMEMSSQQLVDRMLSAEARVDSWKMRTGKNLTESDYSDLQAAMGRLNTAPIFIDDFSGNTVLRMRSTARRLKREHGLGLIVIDYLQLINSERFIENKVNEISEISRALKGLARELEIPVIALSQLSRAVEARGGKPRLSDLRDSGAIEQDADVVMFIHREDFYKPKEEKTNIAEILIEKHRNGATGHLELYFDVQKTSFNEMDDKDEYQGAGYSPTKIESDFSEF